MNDYIFFGSKRIDFQTSFSDRKTLGISVLPDLSVKVNAPIGVTSEKIREKLQEKAPWIIKQQSFFLSFEPRLTKRKYVAGETNLYLGRQYRLKILNNRVNSVKLKGGFLIVSTNDNSKIRSLIKKWYVDHARDMFHNIAEPHIENFKKYKVEPTSIVLKEMPNRWGSCTPKGKIILNPELIQAPKGCIEYVLIHELCHLVYHDHTRKFIELQTKEMPGWEKWKNKLEKFLA